MRTGDAGHESRSPIYGGGGEVFSLFTSFPTQLFINFIFISIINGLNFFSISGDAAFTEREKITAPIRTLTLGGLHALDRTIHHLHGNLVVVQSNPDNRQRSGVQVRL